MKLILAANSTFDAILNSAVTYFNILFFVVANDFNRPLLPIFYVFAIGFLMRLCSSLGNDFTRGVMTFTNFLVACRRIGHFLMDEEISSSEQVTATSTSTDSKLKDHEFSIQLNKFSASWNNQAHFKLNQIDLEIKNGKIWIGYKAFQVCFIIII